MTKEFFLHLWRCYGKWAVENGVTDGVGGNRFAPDQSCTRAQIVTMLYRLLG